MTNAELVTLIKKKYENKKHLYILKCLKFLTSKVFQVIFVLLIFFSFSLPIYIILTLRKLFKGLPIYKNKEIIGHRSSLIYLKLYNIEGFLLTKTSLLSYILKGKINFVGSSFLEKDFLDEDKTSLIFKYAYPGIFNLWFIRQSTKIAHEGVLDTEIEYLATKSLKRDLSIIVKTFPALLYRSKGGEYTSKLNIFDMEFDNISMKEGIDLIDKTIEKGEKKKFFFVNPDCMNKLYVNKEYFSILEKADYVFPDGIGISIACNILKTPLLENVNGTDMLPFLCQLSQKRDYSIFLFGAKPGVAKKMKKKLEEKFPNLKIAGVRDGYFDWTKDTNKIIQEINSSQANILLVAFGVPLQEKWIELNFNKLKPQVLMGVGGLFDFYSGQMKRAPKWMREIGMEWLFRLLKEPKRMWKRYIIGNPLFIYRVYKWKNKRNR